jgi:transcriptional regulator with XRE-family HTH domain
MTKSSTPEVLALLTQYGIRQADLVQRLRVPKSLVSMWFRGKKPIPTYRLPDLWELAALARAAIEAGGKGRDALARPPPTTLVNRRQSGGKTFFTSTWHLSSPPDQWPLPETVEDSDRFWLAQGAEVLRPFARPDFATLALGAATLKDLRQGAEMAVQAIHALQKKLAQMPLPRQEYGLEVATSRETTDDAKRGTT